MSSVIFAQNSQEMRYLAFLVLVLTSSFSIAQDSAEVDQNLLKPDSLESRDDSPPPHWKLKSIYGANGTQSSFVNWNAGGRNNISLLGYITASANYIHPYFDWDNDLNIALGGLQYIGRDADDTGLQKTDDRIEISSKIGYRLKENKHNYISFVNTFKTQFLDGFNYPDDSNHVSTFMAPGYINMALGYEYKPGDDFYVFLSPFSAKMTFVKDQTLANAGAFGVEPAVYDTNGALISRGQQFRGEFGAYFKMGFNKEIAKNINMKTRLELFSNYLENPQNIDVNTDVLFTFKVNDWFSASANFTLIYDHDILITDADGNTGPRTQFKSVLGVGVSYTMKNYSDKKDKKEGDK